MKNLEVEAVLRFYRDIDRDIKITEEWLEENEEQYNPLGAVRYDSMSGGGGTSDKTAMLAVRIRENRTGERAETLRKRAGELKRLRTEIFKEISALTPVHKAIIYGFYIRGQKWACIAEQINYSIRQSKNIRCVALGVLGGKLERNRSISRSGIIKDILK